MLFNLKAVSLEREAGNKLDSENLIFLVSINSFTMYSLFYFNIIPLGLSSKYIIFIVILLVSH